MQRLSRVDKKQGSILCLERKENLRVKTRDKPLGVVAGAGYKAGENGTKGD